MAGKTPQGAEECFNLKRTLSLSILAVIWAALLPMAATCQVSSTSGPATDQPEKTFKYEVYAGYGYTSLNQVNQSRYGLQGVNASVTRDFGRYFGLVAEGDYYRFALKSGNPGNPSIESVFLGPVLHATLYGKFGGFFHGLLGGEHTAGENQTPNISFAGGVGGGMEYSLTPRLSLRATGDYIGASFSLVGNSAELGNSPHKTWDSRAGFGAVYRF
jgi:hypothetical protein